jgi:ferrous iron transport protein B
VFLNGLWPQGSDSLLRSLLVDGIVGGVGGVLVFLPNILLLFLAISFLEGTGYMARAAFIMDRFMHKIGLHGKSFIPMLIGFGCTVPAIMATRTLENRRDRLTTILIAPLMSCGARLPIYALFIPAFFPPRWHAPILWVVYVTGILLAALVAKLLRATIFRGESSPFVMELPPYRLPTLKAVFLHMWERAWLYVKKAGTVILGMSILLWAMTAFPRPTSFTQDYEGAIATAEQEGAHVRADELRNRQRAEEMRYSMAGRIGQGLEPVLRPLGFDWRIGTALVGALAAKEVFVAQLAILFSVSGEENAPQGLREKLRARYTPLTAFCVMLFCLISAPCVATIAVTRRETNAWTWAAFQLVGLTLLAYAVTFVVHQTGQLLGLGV